MFEIRVNLVEVGILKRPNRAFSGRGCAARQPWWFSGKGGFACRVVGRRRRAADAHVSMFFVVLNGRGGD